MVDYESVFEKINKCEKVSEVINLAYIHYQKINIRNRAEIFNQVIKDRQDESKGYGFSLRLAVELSLIFMLRKKNLYLHLAIINLVLTKKRNYLLKL